MKNLRNVVKRRTHLERHQPKARQKLGLLEKKKDYLQRARDYHKKRDYVATLQEKVRQKNPDEFSHKMLRAKQDEKTGKFKKLLSKASLIGNGRKVEKLLVHESTSKNSRTSAEKLSKEQQIRAMHFDHLSKEQQFIAETTDRNYVATRLQMDKKQVEKRRENLHMIGLKDPNQKHVTFSDEEGEDERFTGSKKNRNSAPGGNKRTEKKPKSVNHDEELQDEQYDSEVRKQVNAKDSAVGQARHESYRQLLHYSTRAEKLSGVLSAMENRKQAQEKGKKQPVKDIDGKVVQYKFAMKRAR